MNKTLQLTCLSIVITQLLGGCGGGASGTGGLAGDLNPSSKIGDLTSEQRSTLCDRIVTIATDAFRADTLGPANATVSLLFERYYTFPTVAELSSYQGFGVPEPTLKPIFTTATPQSIEAECEEIFRSELANQSTGQCVDPTQPAPAIGWDPATLEQQNVLVFGRCNLEEPRLSASGVTVAKYAECIEQYLPSKVFPSDTYMRCDLAYEAIKNKTTGILVVSPTDYYTPNEAVENCKAITENANAKWLVDPVVCGDQRYRQPFFVSVL